MASPLDREHYEGNVLDQVADLRARLSALERANLGGGAGWQGISTTDFDTTTLPSPGDYGYQTTDDEIQINVGGTIRAISTSAV